MPAPQAFFCCKKGYSLLNCTIMKKNCAGFAYFKKNTIFTVRIAKVYQTLSLPHVKSTPSVTLYPLVF
jgi:hypothetical protein